MNGSIFQGVELVFRKELTLGLRFKAAWAAMFLFALTTLSCISLAMQGSVLEPRLLAALFWVVLFFSSLAGADRVFGDEDMAGTLLVLKVYGPSQAILLGKMLYTAFILLILAVFITPLFLIFMNGSAALPGLLLGTLLGGIGFVRIFIWQHLGLYDYGEYWFWVGLSVSVSLVFIVLWGTLSGSMIPFLLKRAGLDPATASAPFVATLVDVTGLIIYFTVAALLLGGKLL